MDLLKVLFADDEEIIRNGLKYIIDWEKCGFKICGEASNGKDTISQIIELQPDLVILDICMPGISGIEVITQIHEYFNQNNLTVPQIIILSGYSDFEYAKQAVNLGAKAYLLKPIDEDILQKKVEEAAKSIYEENKRKEERKVAESLKTKEYILQLLNNGENVNKKSLSELPFFENEEKTNYRVITFNCDYINKDMLESVEKTLENYFSFFNCVNIQFANKIILILKTNNDIAVQNCLERAAKLSQERTYICAGTNYTGIQGIIESYKECEKLSEYLYFISTDSYISKETVLPQNSNIDTNLLSKKIDEIIFAIETYNKTKMEEIEKDLYSYLYNQSQKESESKKMIIYCLMELRNNLITKYPEREINDGKAIEIIPKILEMHTFEESFHYLTVVLSEYVENFNFNTTDSIILKVIAYINNNYSKDLKLETLGEMFSCNSAYLGKKFKKYTGVQFNTYVDNLRIEEAKEKLINSDLRIYQVSKLVGYLNTDYFFMKFKKNTGMTPKEFKQKYGKGE